MSRVFVWAAAMMVLVAGMVVTGANDAEAGLFDRNKCCKPARRSRSKQCCEAPKCCEAAPKCCEAAPKCCEAAPVCCAEAAPCESPCTVEATPACGCEATNCACLSKRQLRRTQRKGTCCGYEVKTCGCSAPAPCSGYDGAAPDPADTEAAPEAPESDSTT